MMGTFRDALRHRSAFTLVEIIIAVVILAIVAAFALPRLIDLIGVSQGASEKDVVASVRSGIGIYQAETVAKNLTPPYPETLDTASAGPASTENPLFIAVLAQPVTSQWQKTGAAEYAGPTGQLYAYDHTAGTFDPVIRANLLVGGSGSQVSGASGYVTELAAHGGVGVDRAGYWNSGPVVIGGVTYTNNLSMHPLQDADAVLTFDLEAIARAEGVDGFKRFTALIGVEGGYAQSSVIFRIFTDGGTTPVYESGVMSGTSPVEQVSVNITGARTLTLVTNNAGEPAGYAHLCDHAEFIDPKLE